MQSFTAFTKNEKGLIKVLKTQVEILIDKKINPNYVKKKGNYVAIWDTGATNTVISEKLAKELNLTPVGTVTVSTAGGIREANKYILGLQLPNNLEIQNIMVTGGLLNTDTDFLIGMDIITLGDFAVTNVNGKTVFSFRYPSCEKIDYVNDARNLKRQSLEKQLKKMEQEIKKNGKCPCGSGKLYRYCHGKERIKQIKQELEKVKS